MQKESTMSFKDKVMTVGALGAMVFHAGTFYAVKDKVEKHENNRQQIEIEILNVRVAKREK